MAFDPVTDYPLGSRRPDLVTTPSGLGVDAVTLDAARDGTLEASDVRATAETLGMQAEVARAAGRAQLADALDRAAELTHVCPTRICSRSTRRCGPAAPRRQELEAWASRLDELGAPRNATFVREASEAYRARGLTADG